VQLPERGFRPLQAADQTLPLEHEVSGHDFSRAAKDPNKEWALAPDARAASGYETASLSRKPKKVASLRAVLRRWNLQVPEIAPRNRIEELPEGRSSVQLDYFR